MKISLNWLRQYVTAGASTEVLAHKLTMAGLEVEHIHKVGGDTVFELEITPNRADCLNVLGIAREVSTIFNKPLKAPKLKKQKFPKKKCAITVDDKTGCTRYIGTLIENIHVGAAPAKIKTFLNALGMRPISNVVDITNFCLMETGQPLHAFDYDKLAGGKIIVRRAKKGEKIVTIDDVERKLDPSILVIADAKRPVAIAGIMGGKDTEVTAKTKNILLESAYFDPILIRRAARKLGLTSDSSYRFERGVDYDGVAAGCDRAVSLILESAKGTITARSDVQTPNKVQQRNAVQTSVNKINTYLGAQVAAPRCVNILKKLGFQVTIQAKGSLKVTPPAFRRDVLEEVDIIEEIARVLGYDTLPLSFPQIPVSDISIDEKICFKKQLRENLLGQGCDEVITYALTNQEISEKTLQVKGGVRVKNPLTQEQGMMRMALLPGLLSVVRSNINHGQKDLRFFEMGKSYHPSGEREIVGIIMTGERHDDWRRPRNQGVDFYDIKGAVEEVLRRFHQEKSAIYDESESGCMTPGQQANIMSGKTWYGILGQVQQDVLDYWDIKQQVFFAEIYIDCLYEKQPSQKAYVPVPEFPSINRDVSLAVKNDVAFEHVKEIAREMGGKLLTSIDFTEEYLGEKIPAGHRGIVFSLNYQSSQRTLRDEEVSAIHHKILKAFEEKLNATIR